MGLGLVTLFLLLLSLPQQGVKGFAIVSSNHGWMVKTSLSVITTVGPTRRWSSRQTDEREDPIVIQSTLAQPGQQESLALSTEYEAAMDSLSEDEKYNLLVQGACTKVMERLIAISARPQVSSNRQYPE